ncbi:MAG: hypothetical protein HON90_06235, partial [Halobacteriovoraceae bacterium]|nr:hypothetical protein [Halobacteriovoraceae bacterium]
MTNFKFPKGSMWRRWDLHIHSPDSILENNFDGSDLNEKWDNYINKLEELTDISVIGVADYYSISGYKRLREAKNNGRLKNIDLILPNVECRFNIRTESDGTVNLHFIFNPEIVNELESRFFSNLIFTYNGRPYKCLKDDLIKLGRDFKNDQNLEIDAALKEGVNQFKVSIELIKGILGSDRELCENVFIIVPNSSKDGNSGVQEGGFAASREEVYRISHAIFSGNPNDRKYFLGNGVDAADEVERKCGSLKPCIHGSDAHSLDKIGIVDGERFCWIKSDSSFEGLKQIIIEPDSRVRIQSSNPLCDFKRPYFTNITSSIGKIFNGMPVETSDISLKLNPYMCCIVGGRGTGKSILLDLLRRTFDEESKGRHKDIIHSDFKVSVQKNDGEENEYYLGQENYIDYLHVSQSEVKSIVTDISRLDKEIKIMIGMPSNELNISNESSGEVEKIVEIKEILQQIDENGELKYSKVKYQKLILKNTELI